MVIWNRFLVLMSMVSCVFVGPLAAADSLPDPDGKAADLNQPVQVYILLGQSNMLGFGKVSGDDGSLEHAINEKGLYSYLTDDEGNWTVRNDVRNVRVMGSGTGGARLFNNEFMTIQGGRGGPERGRRATWRAGGNDCRYACFMGQGRASRAFWKCKMLLGQQVER